MMTSKTPMTPTPPPAPVDLDGLRDALEPELRAEFGPTVTVAWNPRREEIACWIPQDEFFDIVYVLAVDAETNTVVIQHHDWDPDTTQRFETVIRRHTQPTEGASA